MTSLHTSRAPTANPRYHGPRATIASMRQVGQAAAAEQTRMDMIKAQRDRAAAKRAADARTARTRGAR